MKAASPPRPSETPDLRAILAWLARSDAPAAADFADRLLTHLTQIRRQVGDHGQQRKLLDLFYLRTRDLVGEFQRSLPGTRPPLARPARQRLRAAQGLLEQLAEGYTAQPADAEARYCAVRCLAWHLELAYLASAPAAPGIWRQLHGLFGAARRAGEAGRTPEENSPTLHSVYLTLLLTAISQPASFNAADLAFALAYIPRLTGSLHLSETPPAGSTAVFWIDPDSDAPANASARRTPPPLDSLLYFTCDAIAAAVTRDAEQWRTADSRRVLHRLGELWGQPARRKFPRRRRTYRIQLFSGLNHLWDMFKTHHADTAASEWMVTNESPEGYALMHVSGDLQGIGIGDIVAVQPRGSDPAQAGDPHIAIVRWALSENPEHFEIGLQLLATRVEAAHVASDGSGPGLCALFLPAQPPLRQNATLILPTAATVSAEQKLCIHRAGHEPQGEYWRLGEAVESADGTTMFSAFPVA